MPTVLAMCQNPVTDGQLDWEGHTVVAYVDVTPPIRTKEAQRAHLDGLEKTARDQIKIIENYIAKIAKGEYHEEEDEDLNADKQQWNESLEKVASLRAIDVPVEELASKYYVGIDKVPSDLKVDIVLNGGCPVAAREPSGEGRGDLLKAVQRHLNPGGKFYNNFNLSEAHSNMRNMFTPFLTTDAPTTETVTFTDEYYKVRNDDDSQTYTIYTRNATTGGRRKTKRSHRRHKRRPTHRKLRR
jgi:hypothetical protein